MGISISTSVLIFSFVQRITGEILKQNYVDSSKQIKHTYDMHMNM